jgi:hypothetical protein
MLQLLTVVVREGREKIGDSVLVFTGRWEVVEPAGVGVIARWPLKLIGVACGARRGGARDGEECGIVWGCS